MKVDSAFGEGLKVSFMGMLIGTSTEASCLGFGLVSSQFPGIGIYVLFDFIMPFGWQTASPAHLLQYGV